MKRDRYESEYERVRRKAGLAKPAEFPEADTSPRHRDVGTPRLIDDDFRERMAAITEADARAAAEQKVRAAALTERANELVRLAEYRRAGVAPMPGVSLSLLLSLGWRVEQVGDENMLVAPPQRTGTGKRREDYERESS